MLNDSILLNPSYASFLPSYSLGFNYLTHKNDTSKGKNFSASIQDGRTELFQAGVTYTKLDQDKFIHVGASKTVIQRLGFSLGGKFYFDNPTAKSGKDMVFSMTGIVSESLQAAFIVDNLLETDAGLARNLYREFILGTKINVMGIVLLYFDPHYVPTYPTRGERWGYEAGIEFPLMSDLYLRGGLFKASRIPFQGVRGRGYGLGLGWLAPRISLDYGLQRVIEPVAATAHVFGATIFF